MRHTEPIDFPEIRAIFARAVREQPTPSYQIQAARETLQRMCQEAAEYGLTTAEWSGLYSDQHWKRGEIVSAQHAEATAMNWKRRLFVAKLFQ